MVDFRKKIAGKKTKLAGKSLGADNSETKESPILDQYVEGNLYKIPLAAISPDPDQPRKHFDKKKLKELSNSIKSKGILQPILIRKNDKESVAGEFLIIAGERRFRASKLAKLDIIPAIYTTGDPEEIALIENLQRDDLKPLEEAEAYARIIESHNYSQGQLSSVVGKARTTINEILTLNKLPEEIKTECRTSDTPKNVLLEIAKQDDPEVAAILFSKVQNENITVAKIRQLTRTKPKRKKSLIEERLIKKIQETKKLIPKIKQESISADYKKMIMNEYHELQEIMIAFDKD